MVNIKMVLSVGMLILCTPHTKHLTCMEIEEKCPQEKTISKAEHYHPEIHPENAFFDEKYIINQKKHITDEKNTKDQEKHIKDQEKYMNFFNNVFDNIDFDQVITKEEIENEIILN